MGWLVMWAAVFMATAMYSMDFAFERRDQYDVDRAGAVAAQMFVWHKAAYQYCNAVDDPVNPVPSPCTTPGKIDHAKLKVSIGEIPGPRGALLGTSVFDNPGDPGGANKFEDGKFVSLVDPVKGVVVTYYNNPTNNGRFRGMVVAQMSAGKNWTAMMGFYDARNHRVDRVKDMAEDDPRIDFATIDIAGVGGEVLPDNVPMIVTKYNNGA